MNKILIKNLVDNYNAIVNNTINGLRDSGIHGVVLDPFLTTNITLDDVDTAHTEWETLYHNYTDLDFEYKQAILLLDRIEGELNK